MSGSSAVEHTGFVESIEDQGIKIRFTSLSACASCHAKGYCSASDMEEKEVFIPNYEGEYRIGEAVDVIMDRSMGYRALFLGYVYPFILVMTLLLILTGTGAGELRSGLIALGSLLPYYLMVYLLRDRISKKFSFSIRKKSYE